MPQQIKIEPNKEYLHVEVSGTFSKANAREFLRQIFGASREHALNKVFVDIRNVKGSIPTMARFDLAEFLASEKDVHVHFAVLESPGQVPNDKFFEIVAANRGGVVKVATDVDEAFQWLGIKPA
jgi:hypothetical protein